MLHFLEVFDEKYIFTSFHDKVEAENLAEIFLNSEEFELSMRLHDIIYYLESEAKR